MNEKNINIIGRVARITILIHGYENSKATEYYDANWLVCDLDIQLGPIKAAFPINLLTLDISSFEEQLRAMRDGSQSSCELYSVEEQIQLKMTKGIAGSVTITGNVNDNRNVRFSIDFSFDMDTSLLSSILSDLANAIHGFPVK